MLLAISLRKIWKSSGRTAQPDFAKKRRKRQKVRNDRIAIRKGKNIDEFRRLSNTATERAAHIGISKEKRKVDQTVFDGIKTGKTEKKAEDGS